MPISRDALVGYAERDLEADLTRWFPDRPPVEIPEDTRPITDFQRRLAAEHATALGALDRLVRSGGMPQVLDIHDWSYGFDFAGNDCGIRDSDYETELTDGDIYSIGADGGGNLYVVLTNGQIAVWFHEEEVLEGNTRFDDLDVFLWHAVRYHAVRAGKLDRAEVEADFLALGQDGALVPELGLLHTMFPREQFA